MRLTGTFTFTSKSTTTAGGHVTYHQHEEYRLDGVTASGERVRLHEQIFSGGAGGYGSAQTGHLFLRRSVKVQGGGSADDFIARWAIHIAIDADGVWRVANYSFTQECV